VVWWCRICDQHWTATTRPTAHSNGIEHLTTEHHATIGTAPEQAPAGRRLSPIPPRAALPVTGRFQILSFRKTTITG
jgi:hypothetical protein